MSVSSSNGDDDDDDRRNDVNDEPTTQFSSSYDANVNITSSISSSNEHADATVTTFDIHPQSASVSSSSSKTSSSSSSSRNSNSTDIDTSNIAQNSAQWTRFLPEAFGIRKSVKSSKYRWCARESSMWGIATGTAMALHRIRMHSPTHRVINVGFTTVFLVMGTSYYFGVKRRDYQEQMIELMMQLNKFEPSQNMPKERPIDETHPFLTTIDDDYETNIPTTATKKKQQQQQQYVAYIPERKEWQAPIPTQDAADVFQPYNDGANNNNK